MLLLSLVCSMTACGVSGSPKDSDKTTSKQTVPMAEVSPTWHYGAQGFAAARQEQQATGAPLAVYFYTDWCPYCKRFDEEFLTATEVRSALTRVVKVRVNPEDGPEEEAIGKRFGARGYPAFFIVRAGTAPEQVYPFKPVGASWVATLPSEFARECQAAAFER
jgi:thiol:disulfide interchange protein